VTLGRVSLQPSRSVRSGSLLSDDLTYLLSRAIEVLIIVDAHILLITGNHLLGNVRLGALEPEYDRFVKLENLVGFDDRCREAVASQDTTKDVDEDGLHLGVVLQNLQRLDQSGALSAAADVQEVGGLLPVLVDDVHGGHGKASTVYKAADVATDVNIVKVVFLGYSLRGVKGGVVLVLGKLFLAVGGVVVDRDLAVSSENFVVLGENEGVDLDHVAVALEEALVELREHLNHLLLVVRDTEVLGSLYKMVAFEPFLGVDLHLENFIRVGVCDILNGHATGGAVDDGWAAGLSVKGQ